MARCSESLGESERALGEYGQYLAARPADRALVEEAKTSRVALAVKLAKAAKTQHLDVAREALADPDPPDSDAATVVDSADDAAHFSNVKWAVETPANTGFTVRVRCATTRAGLSTAAFSSELAVILAGVPERGQIAQQPRGNLRGAAGKLRSGCQHPPVEDAGRSGLHGLDDLFLQ